MFKIISDCGINNFEKVLNVKSTQILLKLISYNLTNRNVFCEWGIPVSWQQALAVSTDRNGVCRIWNFSVWGNNHAGDHQQHLRHW